MTDVLSPILAELTIAAPIDHVWEVMTSRTTVAEWLGCMGYNALVGTTFYMQPDAAKRAANDTSGATHCDVLVLQKPHGFGFSWYVPDSPKTTVQISLFSEGASSTFVRLIHEGWQQFPADMAGAFHKQLKSGWTGDVLPSLKRAAEAN